MKRVCKNVDISTPDFIRAAVYDCLRKSKKRERRDTRQLFARMLHVSRRKAEKLLREQDENYHKGVELVAAMLQKRIISRRLDLKPIRQVQRYDRRCKKIRTISILSIEQLLLDQIAVNALHELKRRVGYYQVSSIKDKGAALGLRAIKKWLGKKSCKRATQTDIQKCYESFSLSTLMPWYHRHVKNRPLLWLIGQLFVNSPKGIPIGSPLSQDTANIYLADLYHFATERCRDKRGRRQIKNVCYQMDDMLNLGSNKRQLRYATEATVAKAAELKLTIKKGWHVFKVEKCRPVDIMGYRFSHNCITLRKSLFVSIRSCLMRAKHAARKGKPTSLARSRTLSSYHGYTKVTNTRKFCERIGAGELYRAAFLTIQYHDKHHVHRQIRKRTGACQHRTQEKP